MKIFTDLYDLNRKYSKHFQGYAMGNPLSKLYHTATSADSSFETRFAIVALSIFSVLSRHAMDIFFVVLFPYSLIASFAYKKSAWPGEKQNTWGTNDALSSGFICGPCVPL